MEERAGAVPASQIIGESDDLLAQRQFTRETRGSSPTYVDRLESMFGRSRSPFLRRTIQHVQPLVEKKWFYCVQSGLKSINLFTPEAWGLQSRNCSISVCNILRAMIIRAD